MTDDTAPPTVTEILAEAQAILNAGNGPMLLSALGQQLNRQLNTSIRKILGQKRLGDLLLESFGDKYEVQGVGPHKEIGLRGTWHHERKLVHYADDFWKAFETPLQAGQRRWLRREPIGFEDHPQAPTGETIEIEPAYVVNTADIRDHKGRFIKQSIVAWSKTHGVDLVEFEKVEPQPVIAPARAAAVNVEPLGEGLRSLRAMIRAVPPSERRDLSLPMDLLARLLDI